MLYIKLKNIAVPLLSLCIITGAIIILQRHIKDIAFTRVAEAIRDTPVQNMALSLFATFVSFCTLSMHEIVAANAAMVNKLPARVPILAGAIGNAFGNTLGFHAITISAWRYRIYSKSGLSVLDIAHITGIAVIGMAFGFAGTAAIALVGDHESMNIAGFIGNNGPHFLGVMLIVGIGITLWLSKKRKQIGLGKFTFLLPDSSILGIQILIGLIEMSAAVYACYILFPANAAPSFAHFTIIYIAATLFGIASHAPGGIGVFEAGMITALGVEGRADIIAALLLYRLIYNLLPFLIASLSAALLEVKSISSIKDSA